MNRRLTLSAGRGRPQSDRSIRLIHDYVRMLLVAVLILPIELTQYPAPLTFATFITPLLVDWQNVGGKWSIVVCGICVSTFAVAGTSAVVDGSFFPILSAISFNVPITGFFLGATYVRSPRFAELFKKGVTLGAAVFAVALLQILLTNDFKARGSFLGELPMGGFGFMSTALGTVFGLPIFAARGVNSLAGICLAIVFLLVLTHSDERRGVSPLLAVVSGGVIVTYGALLQSRSFFFGLVVFVVVLLRRRNVLGPKTLFLVATAAGMLLLYVSGDQRLMQLYEASSTRDLASVTTNRTSLWYEFIELWDPISGTGFREINVAGTGNSSYHNYLFTVSAKCGVLIAVAASVILLAPFVVKSIGPSQCQFRRVTMGAHLAFLVQSMAWDIYAVQLYGHIAWFFVGCVLCQPRSGQAGWNRGEKHLFDELATRAQKSTATRTS